MFEGQPRGLWALALANTGERFGYYTMLAVFALFLGENFGFSAGTASAEREKVSEQVSGTASVVPAGVGRSMAGAEPVTLLCESGQCAGCSRKQY